MTGIKKEVVDIEFEYGIRVNIIQKKPIHQIDRIFDIDAVIAKVDQADIFIKAENKGRGIILDPLRRIENRLRFFIGPFRFFIQIIAAEADMLVTKSN